jgi:hypothetical protein
MSIDPTLIEELRQIEKGDAIEQGDDVLFTVDMTDQPPAERSRSTNSQGYELGICRVCGDEATTPSATYCAEHRTRQPKGQTDTLPPSGTTTVTRPKGAVKGGRKGSQPTADEWSSRIFDKAIILVTALIASSAVRRYQINDPTDQVADSLTATDDEARRIAKPLGRFVSGTGFNKQYGRKILDNSDLIDAGFALYDWYDRVNKTLRTFSTQSHLATVSPIHPEGVANEPTVTQTGNPGPGSFPDFGPIPAPI